MGGRKTRGFSEMESSEPLEGDLGALRGASVQGVFVLAACRGQRLTVCCPAGLFLLVGKVNKVKVCVCLRSSVTC